MPQSYTYFDTLTEAALSTPTKAAAIMRIGNEAVDWISNNKSLNLDAIREMIPGMVTLTCMTELEGKGTVELDNEKLDAFGAPVAKVTLPMIKWDRSGLTKLGAVAPTG